MKRTVGAKTHELRAAQCCLPRFILTGDSLREAKEPAFLAMTATPAAAYSIIISSFDRCDELNIHGFRVAPVLGETCNSLLKSLFPFGEDNIYESMSLWHDLLLLFLDLRAVMHSLTLFANPGLPRNID